MNQLVDVLDCLYRNKKCRTQKYNQNCEVIPGQFCLYIILHSLPQMKFSYKVYTHTCEILFKDAQREKEKKIKLALFMTYFASQHYRIWVPASMTSFQE